jgi:hypothetical protein
MCAGGVPVVPRHTVKFQTLKKIWYFVCNFEALFSKTF